MRTSVLALFGAAAILVGCGEGTGLGNDGTGTISLSVSTGAAGAALQASLVGAAAADTMNDGTNELVITSAEVVLREIELERINDDACDSELHDDDSCEEFEAGPILLDLPLNGEVEQVVSIEADTGTYDEIEFEIHKVDDDDPRDDAFRQAHPDMVDNSIRVQGFYNGQPFTYETDINDEQEYDISPPLVIDENTGSVNVTLQIEIDSWFRDAAGNLVDPGTANKGGENESLVNENIKQSFDAFEDDDHDGEDDDD